MGKGWEGECKSFARTCLSYSNNVLDRVVVPVQHVSKGWEGECKSFARTCLSYSNNVPATSNYGPALGLYGSGGGETLAYRHNLCIKAEIIEGFQRFEVLRVSASNNHVMFSSEL